MSTWDRVEETHAFNATDPVETHARREALLQWARAHGAGFASVAVSDDAFGGHALFAARAIADGAVLGELPYDATIGPEAAPRARHPDLVRHGPHPPRAQRRARCGVPPREAGARAAQIAALYADARVPPDLASALFLLLELDPPAPAPAPAGGGAGGGAGGAAAARSFFAPYLDLLPRARTVPPFWYYLDAPRPSPRTDRTRRVPHPVGGRGAALGRARARGGGGGGRRSCRRRGAPARVLCAGLTPPPPFPVRTGQVSSLPSY
jgi:hypothetical protein